MVQNTYNTCKIENEFGNLKKKNTHRNGQLLVTDFAMIREKIMVIVSLKLW